MSPPQVMDFGKYRGLPFQEVLDRWPDYAQWAVRTSETEKDCSVGLLRFVHFVKSKKIGGPGGGATVTTELEDSCIKT